MGNYQHFDHPLWATSVTINADEANVLAKRYRHGDDTARERLVGGFTRLALVICGKYLAMFKSKRWVDDFVSAAVLGVVTGVESLKQPAGDATNVVAAAIHRAITEMLDDNDLIRVPASSQRRWRQKGIVYEPLSRIQDDDVNEVIIESGLAPDVTAVEDALESVTETELESEIIRLRLEGHTDTEIGSQLGYSQQTVQVVRQGLYDRLTTILSVRKPKHETQT